MPHNLQERDLVLLPSNQSPGVTALRILKRFEFEASLVRSGTIAVDQTTPGSPALLFVKGGPTQVEGLIRGGDLPPDFHKVLS